MRENLSVKGSSAIFTYLTTFSPLCCLLSAEIDDAMHFQSRVWYSMTVSKRETQKSTLFRPPGA